MPDDTLLAPPFIRIPALKLPEGRELEPIDLNLLAEAVRRDGARALGQAALEEATRGAQRPIYRSSRFCDAPWRLVLPRQPREEGRNEAILKALEPLIRRRQALEPLYCEADPALSDYDAIGRFTDTWFQEISETTYFLVAGTGAEIPFSIQLFLSLGKAVGRLGFESPDDYGTYARKVVAAEEGAARDPSRPALTFGPGGDDATNTSRTVLAEPAARLFGAARPARANQALLGQDATGSALVTALSGEGPGAPSLLFSASHGAESVDPRDEDQGALSARNRVLLRAADLRGRQGPFLKHGMALLFACNGGGTPADRWWPSIFPVPPAASPGEDRLAALPLAMLAMLEGPLAVIAHLDVLSDSGLRTHSGLAAVDLNSPGVVPIRDTLSALTRGTPAGIAMRPLARKALELENQLTRTLLVKGRLPAANDVRRNIDLGNAWMRWHDYRGWMLLGDPRVCLEGVPGRIGLGDAMRGG